MVSQLRSWFLDPQTGMLPNFQYGQIHPGSRDNIGSAAGLIEAYPFNDVIEAIRLVNSESAIDRKTMTALKQWFSDFADWMTKQVAYKVLSEFWCWYQDLKKTILPLSDGDNEEVILAEVGELSLDSLPLPSLDIKFCICDKEFEVRVALIIMMQHLLKCDKNGKKITRLRTVDVSDLSDVTEEKGLYIDRVLTEVDKVDTTDYYASMAASWLIAEAFCVKNGKTTSCYRIDVKDELGNLAATVTATGYHVG